jgi:serine protease Do
MHVSTKSSRWFVYAVLAFAIFRSNPALSQTAGMHADALQELSRSTAALSVRVAQSVVQITVTGFGPVDQPERVDGDLVLGPMHGLGSGVIVDEAGYIVTNAHVIANARHIDVTLPGSGRSRSRTVVARIVGVSHELDLALIKVDVSGLSPLPLADYDRLRQGEIVFAFGSPEGFKNSVTMGVVSAVARQRDPDSPLVYVQTDAPINRGNSGGPLVNTEGELVGINTFIVSASGGSEGLGFAIPSAVVKLAVPKLKDFGYLRRGEGGLLLQTITSSLAKGLGLQESDGLVVADVWRDGSAARAGLAVGDIVTTIDHERVTGLPQVMFRLLAHLPEDHVSLGVLRGDHALTLDLVLTERPSDADRWSDLVDPSNNVISKLGVVGVDINERSAPLAGRLRMMCGVFVVGHTKEEDLAGSGVMAGDVIHAVNGASVTSVDELRAMLAALQPGAAVAMQIERNGQLQFLGFQID